MHMHARLFTSHLSPCLGPWPKLASAGRRRQRSGQLDQGPEPAARPRLGGPGFGGVRE